VPGKRVKAPGGLHPGSAVPVGQHGMVDTKRAQGTSPKQQGVETLTEVELSVEGSASTAVASAPVAHLVTMGELSERVYPA
jgi:hypothetical protein